MDNALNIMRDEAYRKGFEDGVASVAPSILTGLDEAMKQKLREALRFSASRSVMSAEDERRILSALETPTNAS